MAFRSRTLPVKDFVPKKAEILTQGQSGSGEELALGNVGAECAEDRGAVPTGSGDGIKTVGAEGPKGPAHVESGGNEDEPSARKLLGYCGRVFPGVSGAGEPADPLPRNPQGLGGLGHEGDPTPHPSFPAHKPELRLPAQSPKEPNPFDQTIQGSGGKAAGDRAVLLVVLAAA